MGPNPVECVPHGAPVPYGRPVFCLDCSRAIRGTEHRCFRHVKPKSLEAILIEQTQKRKSFAERLHGKRKKRRVKVKLQLKPRTIDDMVEDLRKGVSSEAVFHDNRSAILDDLTERQASPALKASLGGGLTTDQLLTFFEPIIIQMLEMVATQLAAALKSQVQGSK